MTASRLFIDTCGRSVVVPSSPQRLVSLVPSITETLFAFGWGAQVVGITDYCTEPATEVLNKATIGGTKNPRIADILDLQPQLVFTVAEENRQDDVAQLEAAGVPVYVFEPRTVRDGIDLLWRVAELLGCTTAVSPDIAAIEQAYADTVAVVAARQQVRVFCPIWKDPYMTINHATYVHAMLEVCGGENVFAGRQRRFPLAADLGQALEASGERYNERDRRYPRVTLEEMAARQPQVILLPDEPYVFGESDKADFLLFPNVPAVQNRRLYLIDGKMVSWYGPRIGESLHILRTLLAPTA